MLPRLNPQQALFVKKLMEGSQQKDAAILAGYSKHSADSIASQLLKNPKVIEALDRVGLTDQAMAKMLKANIKAGNKVKATADTSLRGIELAYRLKGYLDRSSETTNLSQTNVYINELKTLDDDALQSKLSALLEDVTALKERK